MSVDIADLAEQYKDLPDEELTKIVVAGEDRYVEAALQVAQKELLSRGVDFQNSALAKEIELKAKAELAHEEAESQKPLGGLGKAVCFIDTLLVPLIIILYLSAKKRRVAEDQAIKWWFMGWIFKAAMIALIKYT